MDQFAQRLRSARLMAGLSLQALSDKINHLVTKQAISRYENGEMQPNGRVLLALAEALDVRPEYFFKEPKHELDRIEFRKWESMKGHKVEQLKKQVLDFLERYFELEEIIGIDTDFVNPIHNNQIKNLEDVEDAAQQLRDQWKLGINPIPNVIETLEDHEIKVLEIEADDQFDGLSAYVSGHPVIVLNKSLNEKLDRKRFTALHEAAHLLLQFSDTFSHKEKERLCHAFAGAVLIPKEVFIKEFGQNRVQVLFRELGLLKQHYGISMQAIIVRARNLGLISSSVYQNLFKMFNRLGYRVNEPAIYNYQGLERSLRFEQLLYRAVAQEMISLSKAAALNNQKLAVFRDTITPEYA